MKILIFSLCTPKQQHNIFFNLKYCTAGHSYTYVYCIKWRDKVPEMAITGVDC